MGIVMEPSCPCSIRVMNNAIPGTGGVLRVLTNKVNILPTFVKHLLQPLTHNFLLNVQSHNAAHCDIASPTRRPGLYRAFALTCSFRACPSYFSSMATAGVATRAITSMPRTKKAGRDWANLAMVVRSEGETQTEVYCERHNDISLSIHHLVYTVHLTDGVLVLNTVPEHAVLSALAANACFCAYQQEEAYTRALRNQTAVTAIVKAPFYSAALIFYVSLQSYYAHSARSQTYSGARMKSFLAGCMCMLLVPPRNPRSASLYRLYMADWPGQAGKARRVEKDE